MDGGKAHYVTLLKSVRNVKQQIDKFLLTNQDEIDELEITRIRNSVEKILNMYLSPHAERDTANNSSMFVQHFDCDQRSTKSKMKELLDITSSFCAEFDTMKSSPKQKTSKECQTVTNEDCSNNKQQTDLHEKVNYLEDHIEQLQCCLKEFVCFLIKFLRLGHNQKVKKICLENEISKLKKKECHYQSRIQRLSKKLDYARKTSKERQQKTAEVVSKIEQLKRMAEKNAMDWSDMAESISSVAVDLSLSCWQSTCDDRPDGDDDNDNCCDDEDDNDGDDNCCGDDDGSTFTKNKYDELDTLCCQSGGGFQSVLQPLESHSTPIRSRVKADYPCPTTTTTTPETVVRWADDVGEPSALCSSETVAITMEKSTMKVEPPTPCRRRPLPNLSRHERKSENGIKETQLSKGIPTTDGVGTSADWTSTNCLHCTNRRMRRNFE